MFQLEDLPYAYNALEPYIDEETMKIHHQKHHQGYLNKFNKALEGYNDLLSQSVKSILSNPEQIPKEIRTAVINNGGGYYHHNLFWKMMNPESSHPSEVLKKAIDDKFGSLDNFRQQFTDEAMKHFASGWTWLVQNQESNLSIISTDNQNSPISLGFTPLLGIDTWEHAYYLKYQNRRPDYIQAWWDLVNWDYSNQKFNS